RSRRARARFCRSG
ncbi:methyl-accepting chemotaxis protein, partial [Vibrio cholerae O1 str. NHCC-006C]